MGRSGRHACSLGSQELQAHCFPPPCPLGTALGRAGQSRGHASCRQRDTRTSVDVSPELEGLGPSALLDQGWSGNDPGAKATCAVQSLGCSLDAEMMPGFTRHVFIQSRGWAVDVDLSTPGAAAGQNRGSAHLPVVSPASLSITLGGRSPVPQSPDCPTRPKFSMPHDLGSPVLCPEELAGSKVASGHHAPSRGRDGASSGFSSTGSTWHPSGARPRHRTPEKLLVGAGCPWPRARPRVVTALSLLCGKDSEGSGVPGGAGGVQSAPVRAPKGSGLSIPPPPAAVCTAYSQGRPLSPARSLTFSRFQMSLFRYARNQGSERKAGSG